MLNLINEAEYKNIPKNVLLQCKGYPKYGLYIYGGIGVGKTYTSIAIGKHFGNFLYKKVSDIVRDVRACKTALDEYEYINKIVNQRHLIIDDIGVEKLTEFSYSIVYEVLDKRTLYNPEALIINSNLTISELAKVYDDRIASRIAGICKLVKIEGKDRRINKENI